MPRFLVIFAAGLAAAASVGKLVPHLDWMAAQFAVSLAAAGFLVSAVMLPGVLLGPVLGVITDRFGAKRLAVAGLGIQACSSLAAGYAGSFPLMVLARLAEGAGYSLAVVAATVLVVEGASERRQPMALAMWSAFAPLGFALGQWFAGGVGDADPLPLIGRAHALALGALAALLAFSLPRGARRGTAMVRSRFFSTLAHAPALRTALAFGCATAALLGAVALAPLAVAAQHGLTVAAAAQLTALAALPGIVGRFASGWLLGAAARPFGVFLVAGAAGSAFLIAALASAWPLGLALACFALFQICIGALPGVMSAMLPWVTPAPGQLGTVSGLANQLITAGNLVAPPLVLGIYAIAGLGAALAALIGGVALSIALVGSVAVYHKPLSAR